MASWDAYNSFENSGTKSNQRLLQTRLIIFIWYFLRQMTMFIWVIDCKKNYDPISFSSRGILIFQCFCSEFWNRARSRAIFPLQLRLKWWNRNQKMRFRKQKSVSKIWSIQIFDHIAGCSYIKFEAWRTICLLWKTQPRGPLAPEVQKIVQKWVEYIWPQP